MSEAHPGDLLTGADQIAEFLFGDASARRRTYYLAEGGELPIFTIGGRLTSRKSTLARHFEELEKAGASKIGEVA